MAARNAFFKFSFCYNILDRESEYLFAIFDSNNDGNIDIAEELNIRYKTLKSENKIFENYFLTFFRRDSLIEKGNFGSPPCTIVSK